MRPVMRWWWAGAGTGLVCLVGAVVWMWGARQGDVDPGSALVALVGAALAVVSLRQGLTAQRQAESDVEVWAEQLARLVLKAESAQHHQLLGAVEAIEVGFSSSGQVTARREPLLGEIVGFYRGLKPPQRLVVTGGPGAGKTVLAVTLILGLLRSRAAGQLVPVRLSAADWDPEVSVRDWLTGQLTAAFGLAPVTAEALLEAGRILPVIDGLDEMDELDGSGYGSRAGLAVQALNKYQWAGKYAPLVLTCRSSHYEALTEADTAIGNAVRIVLHPVSPIQACQFLRDRAGRSDKAQARWEPVLDQLGGRYFPPGEVRQNNALADALFTPWQLTLAATVYNERDQTGAYRRDPQHLTTFTTDDEVKAHLLPLFIPARVADARAAALSAGRSPHRLVSDPDKTHRWLAELARHLRDNSSRSPLARPTPARPRWRLPPACRTLSNTDLTLHELWAMEPHRSRTFGLLAGVAVMLTVIAIGAIGLLAAVLFHPALGYRPLQIYGVLAAALGFTGLMAVPGPLDIWWPQPARFSFVLFGTPPGRREVCFRLLAPMGLWLVGGLAGGFVLGLLAGFADGITTEFNDGFMDVILTRCAHGVANGLGLAVVAGPIFGFAFFMDGFLAPDAKVRGPRDIIRVDVVGWVGFGLAYGLVSGVTGGLMVGFVSGQARGWAFGITFGLVLGLVFGLWLKPAFSSRGLGGLVGLRYFGFLLATRGRLPWFLGRFLDQAYQVGLLRISGIAYQFRHEELQTYLAAHNRPPSSH